MFLNPSIVYKVSLFDVNNNLIWTYDPVYPFADAGVAQNITFAGTSTGSPNAQILNGLSSFTNGQIIEWTAGFTNTGAMTLSVFQMYQGGTGGPQVLTGGEVQVGTTYFSIFLSALNSNAGGFQLTASNLSPTQAPGNNSTANANTAFVTAALAAQKTPQTTILTTGMGTYTTPTGATYLEIEIIGGGSGGGGAGTTTTGGAGGAGGATTFGTSLLTANGGPATPTSSVTSYPTPATATGSTDIVGGGLGGPGDELTPSVSIFSVRGGNGAGTFYGAGAPGGTNVALALPGTAVAQGSGGGGGAITANTVAFSGWGGNAGAFLRALITAPVATYAYAVGVAGVAGAAGTSGSAGSAGASGYIRVVARFQ